MYFEIIGEFSAVETIATGSGIRELARLSANSMAGVVGVNAKALCARG
jgi:hypothetical protein